MNNRSLLKTSCAVILLLCCCQLQSYAQLGLGWAKQTGGIDYDAAQALAIDGNGNVYTTGTFNGTVDFDGSSGVYNLTSAGAGDVFVLKTDSLGNFIWARSFGNASDDIGLAIAVDASGNVYGINNFMGTIDADPGAGTFMLTATLFIDPMIWKLDASGNFVWAKQLASASTGGSANTAALTIDASGNIYNTGYFNGYVDFDPNAGTNIQNAPNADTYILKLDASGNFVWIKTLPASQSSMPASISVDGSGNVHTIGSFMGDIDLDPGAGTNMVATAGFDNDIYISKLDASGNFVWGKAFTGSGYDFGMASLVDATGNVYISGAFEASMDFDPGQGVANLTSTTSYNAFITKLDASGNYVWAKNFSSADYSFAQSMAFDAGQNIFVTGYFKGVTDFDAGTPTYNVTPFDASDIYFAKLNAAGDLQYATGIGGTSDDYGNAIRLSQTGAIHVAGAFMGAGDYDPGQGVANLSTAGSGDIVVGKYIDLSCQSTASTITAAACDTFTLGTTNYTASGTFVQIVPNAAGCDSVITINLTITNTTTGTLLQTACDSFTFNGQTYTTTGLYTQTLTNAAGCDSILTIDLTIQTIPALAVTAAGSTTFCQGGDVALSITGTGYTYQWQLNGTDISGATNDTYNADASGSYQVIITNSNSCSGPSQSITVTANPLPVPVITANGNVLDAGSFATYQWALDGQDIAGAQSATYSYIQDGSYTVTVTDANGCEGTSAAYNTTTSVSSVSGKDGISIYPNPAKTAVYFDTPYKMNVSLTDVNGRVVLKQCATNSIDVSALANGVYMLTLKDKNGNTTKAEKLVIIK